MSTADRSRYQTLLAQVESVGVRYHARDEPHSVGHAGAVVGSRITITRKGIYQGLQVSARAPIPRLWTAERLVAVIRRLEGEQWQAGWRDLGVQSHREAVRWIRDWLTRVQTGVEPHISTPLPGPLRVEQIGARPKGGSVVPPEWVGREWPDANALHAAMDTLPWRAGMPPVTYALTYGAIVSEPEGWSSEPEPRPTYRVALDQAGLTATRVRTPVAEPGYQYRTQGGYQYACPEELWGHPEPVRTEACGLLVSRLQKAIRRGPGASRTLEATVRALAVSPSYILPDHGFQRVSAAKGLVWRLAITSLEDATPGAGEGIVDLLTLVCLSVVTHLDPDRYLSPLAVEHLLRTALALSWDSTPPSWKPASAIPPTVPSPESRLQQGARMATALLPMMAGDRRMIAGYYQADPEPAPLRIRRHPHRQSDPEVEREVVLSSYDQHSVPGIILLWAASLPLGPTLTEVSSRIWEESSRDNYRFPDRRCRAPESLRTVQSYLAESRYGPGDRTGAQVASLPAELDPYWQRISWLQLFGQVYRVGRVKTVLAGEPGTPARRQVGESWEVAPGWEDRYPTQQVTLTRPPPGHTWRRAQVQTAVVDGQPQVDGTPLPWYDGSSLCERWDLAPRPIPRRHRPLVEGALRGQGLPPTDLLYYRDHGRTRATQLPDRVHRGLLWHVYVLLETAEEQVVAGPVGRDGKGTERAVHPLYEGAALGVLAVLHWAYPDALVPRGPTRYAVYRDSPQWSLLLSETRRVGAPRPGSSLLSVIPRNVTPFRPNQRDTLARIWESMDAGGRGWGEASRPGSGKTYEALAVGAEAVRRCQGTQWSGVCVALATAALMETWETEIELRTTGWQVYYHRAGEDIPPVTDHTLVVTTLGRMRDHPARHPWALYVVDECLSVKNENALWTQEAWRQSLAARYVLMLSATFFRSKFKELYYMLKMLGTGLPERTEYLDIILLESIHRRMPASPHTWTETYHRISLRPRDREVYQEARETEGGDKRVWTACVQALGRAGPQRTLHRALRRILRDLEGRGRRALLYADSQAEAEEYAEVLGVSQYPDLGRHTVITVSRGAYGLNNLVCYDTLLLRPPRPDLLPQIQGRLDRPGQQREDLEVHYYLFGDTVEEGLVLRMRAAEQFGAEYMMPLTQFYGLALRGE